jgi:hypothetical protein
MKDLFGTGLSIERKNAPEAHFLVNSNIFYHFFIETGSPNNQYFKALIASKFS